MGEKVLGYFLGLLVLIITLIYLVNLVLLHSIKSDVIAAEQVLITYAQTNGGFVDTGSESFPVFYDRVLEQYNLKDKIDRISFSPSVGEKVQKGSFLTVSISPKFPLIVPFSDKTILFTGKEVTRSGISRLYRKELD